MQPFGLVHTMRMGSTKITQVLAEVVAERQQLFNNMSRQTAAKQGGGSNNSTFIFCSCWRLKSLVENLELEQYSFEQKFDSEG